jgi:chemotaxis signal transduction protein
LQLKLSFNLYNGVLKISDMTIPVVDLAAFTNGDLSSKQQFVNALGKAY